MAGSGHSPGRGNRRHHIRCARHAGLMLFIEGEGGRSYMSSIREIAIGGSGGGGETSPTGRSRQKQQSFHPTQEYE